MRKKLNENQALSGMLKLYDLIQEPVHVTRKMMSEESGIPLAKLSVLSQEGIIKCESTFGLSEHGRKVTWEWIGVRPNIHMAKKLVSTNPTYPCKEKDRKVEAPTPKPQNVGMRSRVVIRKSFEITKALEGESVTLKVDQDGKDVRVDPFSIAGPNSVEKLRCVGYAFLTAADELLKSE